MQLPDLDPLDADQQLGVRRLGEGEVERPLATASMSCSMLGWITRRIAPPDQEEDADQRQHLVGPPAAQSVACRRR